MISVRALVAGLVVMVVARPVIVLAAKTRPRPSLHPAWRSHCLVVS